jgi:hypothetical protein
MIDEEKNALIRLQKKDVPAAAAGDAGFATALAVVSPLFGQIQLAIDQGMTLRTGVGQKDADLAVLNPAGGTAILACHAGGMAAFLEKASFINHAYGSTVSQIVGQIGAQTVTQCIGIPVSAAKQVLKAIRIGGAADLGQLPAILAFGRTEQSGQIGHSALSRVGTGKERPNPAFNLSPVELPHLHIGQVKLDGRMLARCIDHQILRGEQPYGDE